MFWSIIHRTIFMDLARVFLTALVALTSLLLLAGIVAEASQHGLGPAQILQAIPLLIPSTLPYTLPATTLFATCVVFGRLSSDNEIVALKSAGIHLRHVIWPAALLGMLITLTTVFLYIEVIPTTHHELRTRIVTDVEEFLYGMLKRDGCIRHPKINYTIYVRRMQGKKLLDATFMRKDAKGQMFDIIARAKEAELRYDSKNNQILVDMRKCYIQSDNGGDEAYVEAKVWPVDMPPDFKSMAKTSARAMTWWELFEQVDKIKEQLEKTLSEIAIHQEAINRRTADPHFSDHVRDLLFKKKALESQLLQVYTEIHMRPSLAMGCLCFVMVGCPIGIWFSRSDYLSAFITCFLPIVMLYYPLLLCAINLSKSGRIAPAYAIHTANGFMAILAVLLFRRLLRH